MTSYNDQFHVGIESGLYDFRCGISVNGENLNLGKLRFCDWHQMFSQHFFDSLAGRAVMGFLLDQVFAGWRAPWRGERPFFHIHNEQFPAAPLCNPQACDHCSHRSRGKVIGHKNPL